VTLSETPIICSRPFEWFEIQRQGHVFLCCPSWLKRPLGNLLQQSVADIWNGPVARELRKSILNGSFHNCNRKRCPFLTTQTDPVTPLAAVANRDVRQAIRDHGTTLSYLPRRLNLSFDHSCNLVCPSCRKDVMSLSAGEQKDNERITTIIREELLPTATEVTMSGFGDPFASPAYTAILRHINTMSGKRPRLRLHSNGQLWTAQRWEQLSGLHGLVTEAEISVDAASAATYHLNRPGGSFARLLENLAYLAQQSFPLTLSMVVQANNFREIPAFIELAEKYNARAYLSQLVNWGTFTKADYLSRAVHLPGHPEHRQLCEMLSQRSDSQLVNLGNLSELAK